MLADALTVGVDSGGELRTSGSKFAKEQKDDSSLGVLWEQVESDSQGMLLGNGKR